MRKKTKERFSLLRWSLETFRQRFPSRSEKPTGAGSHNASARTHGSETRLRATLEPLLIKNNVSLVLNGHDHVYERIKPQNGIQYFVTGSGGQLRDGDLRKGSPLTAKWRVAPSATGRAISKSRNGSRASIICWCTVQPASSGWTEGISQGVLPSAP